MDISAIRYMLMVHDMDRAVAFYTDTLGFQAGYTSEMWTELSRGGAGLALHGGADEGELRETGVCISVADLQAACREVVAGGGRVTRDPERRPGEPIMLATVSDTEGNVLSLDQYIG